MTATKADELVLVYDNFCKRYLRFGRVSGGFDRTLREWATVLTRAEALQMFAGMAPLPDFRLVPARMTEMG